MAAGGPGSGRGKRGQLSFPQTPESLRNEMMEQALNNGQQQIALELAQLAPVELKALLHPFLGGQWQNNTPTLRIPYYRPLEPLRPGFLPGRAEQHLAGQIYAGLTRFDEGDNMPIGDLAHHWQVSPTACAGIFISAPRCAGTMAIRWKPRSCDSGYCCCLSCPPCGPSSPASAVSMSPCPVFNNNPASP